MSDGGRDLAAPLWRGRLHLWAAIVGVPAGVALVLSARGAAATTSAAVFAASVVLAFGTSAAYHRGRWTAAGRRIMQRLDHTMIYVLIAGSYVPVSLLAMPPGWAICVLALVTTGAGLGMLRSLVAFDRWRAVGVVLYVVLGWTALAAMPVLVTRLTVGQLVLFVVGGVLYTAGLPILLTHRPNPWPRTFGYHEIWHTFTVAAVLCHFGGVQLLVR